MKILVTGANGFIGKNLACHLKERGHQILPFVRGNAVEDLRAYLNEADFVAHLAGVNRPLREEEFAEGNVGLTRTLVEEMGKAGRKTPIFFSSSTQAELDNPYGRSKKAAEDLILSYGRETGAPVYVRRLCNVYGKWCRPNYNSAIATWCFSLTHGMPIEVNEAAGAIDFAYVDDVCEGILSLIENGGETGVKALKAADKAAPKEVASILRSFEEGRKRHEAPSLGTPFKAKLYATYASYLDEGNLAVGLDAHVDDRGLFAEILRSNGAGQISVNVIRPGIVKGNHYHHTKSEKFLVVSGECVTTLKPVFGGKAVSYQTSGDGLKAIDIPPGWAHSIKNVGKKDAVVLMWASEPFDPNRPDTYPMGAEDE